MKGTRVQEKKKKMMMMRKKEEEGESASPGVGGSITILPGGKYRSGERLFLLSTLNPLCDASWAKR